MAITGVSAISGQQIIAAGAVSAKNAAMDSNGGYLTAKLTKASADTLYQPIGNYQTAGDYLTTGDSANFYTTANESGFATTSQLQTVSGEITGLIPTDLFTKASADTLYQPIGNYQTAGDYLTTGDSANFYTTANDSGFITTAGQTVTSTAGDGTYITAINAVPISGKGDFTGLFQAQYGTTTYNDIKNAVDNHKIVYCQSGGRMAFLAYSGSNNYEFQYYRSLTGHTTAAQGDQVFVYTISSNNNWGVTTRNTYTEIKPSAGLTSAFTNGTAAKLAFSVSNDILNATATVASNSATWDAKLDATAFSYVSGGFLTTAEAANFYSTANESGFITDADLAPYQTTAGMTAYQPAGDYLTTADSSEFYTTGNESGFISEVPDTYLQNTDLTIVDNKITEISGVPLSAGDELPSGVMVESAVEYNAVNEISGYNGSAIAQYGAEKQWLQHDDTLVHAANSAQYALGVNLSAVAQLLGVDETVLWSGNLSAVDNARLTASEDPLNFEFLDIYMNGFNDDLRATQVFRFVSTNKEYCLAPQAFQGLTQRLNHVRFQFNGTVGTCSSTIQYLVDTNGIRTASDRPGIIKVVGISRKN